MRATSARVLDQRVKVLSVPPTSHGDGVCRVLLYLGHLRGPLGRPVAPQTKLSSASHLTPDDLLASSETDTEMRICWCWAAQKNVLVALNGASKAGSRNLRNSGGVCGISVSAQEARWGRWVSPEWFSPAAVH